MQEQETERWAQGLYSTAYGMGQEPSTQDSEAATPPSSSESESDGDDPLDSPTEPQLDAPTSAAPTSAAPEATAPKKSKLKEFTWKKSSKFDPVLHLKIRAAIDEMVEESGNGAATTAASPGTTPPDGKTSSSYHGSEASGSSDSLYAPYPPTQGESSCSHHTHKANGNPDNKKSKRTPGKRPVP